MSTMNEDTDYQRGHDLLQSFVRGDAAIGLMSEIDIPDGKSVSCHGQGVIGQWGPMRVVMEPAG